MTEKNPDPTVANQVELAVCRLDSLSTLSCVAARVLSQLLQTPFSPSALAETIESDPALTARIFLLMHQQGLNSGRHSSSLGHTLEKLPQHIVRDAVLSVRVFPAFDNNHENRIFERKQLIHHSLAVACCAKDIAEILSDEFDPQSAYSAGLLHDIGKLALEEVMPKSFARIVEEAKSEHSSTFTIEQKRLGQDHATLGSRLAKKWHLPEQIALAIWLHHSDTVAVSQSMPEAKMAQLVQLADVMARQCGIGQSGSYDSPDSGEQIAQSLGIGLEQLEQIRRALPEKVEQKFKALGLDSPGTTTTYCETAHSAAAKWARDNGNLSLENRRLQTAAAHFDFTKDFLFSIESNTLPIEIAENFAVRWQKFYQTGMVCLYLAPAPGSKTVEAVLVETLARTKNLILKGPVGSPPIPEVVVNKFEILDAANYAEWLFAQLDVDFDLSQTKLAPLLSNGRAVGAIAFEVRYPGDAELFRENFEAATSIAGSVLDRALISWGQQHFAERFARLLTRVKTEPLQTAAASPAKQVQPPVGADPLAALAEIAGGAAHELNNPLSVISGRAQLLAGAETDPEKRRLLRQIQENTDELSTIVEDLMTYAKPPSPRTVQTNIKQMLDEAIQLTSQKTHVEHVNAQIEVVDGLKTVFVDSAQIVSAVANVICNSLESYTDKTGPVKISAESSESGDFVILQISDLGRGMDSETIKKAAQPFFSGRTAGRKRGMGLAHAQRLIELNRGSLQITSELGSGTTVTILLPCK